jgi:predicted Zn-dependent peptidase
MKKIITFPSGMRVAMHPMKYTRVVTIGVYVGVGSSCETKDINGISHFIEHMVFKGTERRSAFEIADEMESIGAQINAFTSRDCTAFYTISTDEHTEKCFDVLSDIFFHSKLSEDSMENEKGVVIEEINMCNDDPTDLCQDQLNLAHFGDTGLGRPILGTIENVRSFTPEKLRQYMSSYYCADNVVISVAGNFNENAILDLINTYFEQVFVNKVAVRCEKTTKRIFRRQLKILKPTEQINIAFAFPSYKISDKKIPQLYLLSNILGGGMSSRLFQKLREENGLVYDVYATDSEYKNTGMFMVYLAAKPESAEKAVRVVKEVFDDIKSNLITQQELNKGKEQLKSSLVFGSEKAVSVMRSNGIQVLLADRTFNMEKRLEEIEAITMDGVAEVIGEVLNFADMSCSYVGKENGLDPINILRG